MEEIKLAQEEEKEFHKYLSDHFSHVSRALTKYSYGLSKATSSKLQILMTTPWKIFQRETNRKKGATINNNNHLITISQSLTNLFLLKSKKQSVVVRSH